MTGLFITATDTGVGMTKTTACLAAAFRAQGRAPRAVKPVAISIEPNGGEAEIIATAAGHNALGFASFTSLTTPQRGSAIAKVSLDDASLIAWCRAQKGDPVLMEGVGGWCVPLTEALTVEDLAMAIKLPVLVVAGNTKGMVSHTLLTIEAVRGAGLAIAGVVINNATDHPSPLQRWNSEDIQRWLGPTIPVAILGEIGQGQKALTAAGQGIIKALAL
jgi:dethiobiotin synthetase